MVDLGSVTEVLDISNQGNAGLEIGDLIISGPGSTAFRLDEDYCSGQTLTPGESQSVQVVFEPLMEGEFIASLVIPSNDPDEPIVEIDLAGSGVKVPEAALHPLPDTGQDQCYDNIGSIACPTSGQDFYGQDSQCQRPRSYTKLGVNGNDLLDTVSEWSTVRDNVTGLIWEIKQAKDEVQDYTNPNDADNTYTWYDSEPTTNGGDAGLDGSGTDTSDFIDALNDTRYGGYNDWRLPTVKELFRLIDRSGVSPPIDEVFFPSIINYENYWTSNSYCTNPSLAWYVKFYRGACVWGEQSSESYVRAVRSSSSELSLNHLMSNGDGTATDIDTGLMWQYCAVGNLDWQGALAYCENLILEGSDDWRLPDVNELQSLVDYSGFNLPIVLQNGQTCWSSTTSLSKPWASTVRFPDGYCMNYLDKDESYGVLAVRSVYASPSAVYISHDGYCGGQSPCYGSIQAGYDVSGGNTHIKIRNDEYFESLIFHPPDKRYLVGRMER